MSAPIIQDVIEFCQASDRKTLRQYGATLRRRATWSRDKESTTCGKTPFVWIPTGTGCQVSILAPHRYWSGSPGKIGRERHTDNTRKMDGARSSTIRARCATARNVEHARTGGTPFSLTRRSWPMPDWSASPG